MGEEQPRVEVAESEQREVAAFVAARDVMCPACEHNLRGSAGVKCPECGVALRLEVRADPLPARSWWVAAVLTWVAVMAFAQGGRGLYSLVTQFQPLPSTTWLVWMLFIGPTTVQLGIGLGGSVASFLAWRAWRRKDRYALGVASGRAVMLLALAGLSWVPTVLFYVFR
ncbi:MAG: hypothetical protein K2X32_10075 [Phycisphaerales bacterium]|nr:hypothetical protein [Phycisphaerales bacterium]